MALIGCNPLFTPTYSIASDPVGCFEKKISYSGTSRLRRRRRTRERERDLENTVIAIIITAERVITDNQSFINISTTFPVPSTLLFFVSLSLPLM